MIEDLHVCDKVNKYYISLSDEECCTYVNMCVDRYRQYMEDNYNGIIHIIKDPYGYRKYRRLYFNTKKDCTNAIEYIESCVIMNRLSTGRNVINEY